MCFEGLSDRFAKLFLLCMLLFTCSVFLSAEDSGNPDKKDLLLNICTKKAFGQQVSIVKNRIPRLPSCNHKLVLTSNGDYFCDAAKYSGTNGEMIGFCEIPGETFHLRSPYICDKENKVYFTHNQKIHLFSTDCKYLESINLGDYKWVNVPDSKEELKRDEAMQNNGVLLFKFETDTYAKLGDYLVKLNFNGKQVSVLCKVSGIMALASDSPVFSGYIEVNKQENGVTKPQTVKAILDCRSGSLEVNSFGEVDRYIYWNKALFALKKDGYDGRTLYSLGDNGELGAAFAKLKGREIIGSEGQYLWTWCSDISPNTGTCLRYEYGQNTEKEIFSEAVSGYPVSKLCNGRVLTLINDGLYVLNLRQGTLNMPFTPGLSAFLTLSSVFDEKSSSFFISHPPYVCVVDSTGKESTSESTSKLVGRTDLRASRRPSSLKIDQSDGAVCLILTSAIMARKKETFVYVLKIEDGKLTATLDEKRDLKSLSKGSSLMCRNATIREILLKDNSVRYLGSFGGKHFILVEENTIKELDDAGKEIACYSLPEDSGYCEQMVSEKVLLTCIKREGKDEFRTPVWYSVFYNIKTGEKLEFESRISASGDSLSFVMKEDSCYITSRFNTTKKVLQSIKYKYTAEKKEIWMAVARDPGSSLDYGLVFDSEFSVWLTIKWKESEDKESERKLQAFFR